MLRNRYSLVPVMLCLALCCGMSSKATGQSSVFNSIAQDFDLHRKGALQEKIFLHLDRPLYACGETMWFKVYNVDGTLHQPISISKVAYVEVLDAANKPVLQAKVALEKGIGNGSFVLPMSLTSGNYRVRGYTNWMKNFGPELYFEQPVTIVNTFRQLNDKEIAASTADYAIQFYPEGGNLVAGVANKVAFKATDTKTGKGVSFYGELYDQQGKVVTSFTPHRFGIGQFTFTPAGSTKYTAVIKLANNQRVSTPLPKVYTQGYTLQLADLDQNRLKLTINQVGQPGEQVYLLGHARQIVTVSEVATINQGSATFLVDKRTLAEGTTHFTVFNSQKQPVCERLYFKHPIQRLQLKVGANKQQYGTREKVELNLLANTATEADLSLAVYKLDALQGAPESNIESYLWLTSDLKGTVEQASYYLSGEGETDQEAIDNLMLTHGWSRFRWESILGKEPAVHTNVPEYSGHWINGRVTNRVTGNPEAGVTTFMSSPGKLIRLYNSISDANGLIHYEVKDLYGEKDIVVQSDFTKDSTYHFEVFNPFSVNYSTTRLPAFQVSEALKHELTLRHVQLQTQHAYYPNYTNRFRLAGIDSVAFYGRADEQYFLDDYKRFKVMEEVMREYVPGVQVRRRNGRFHFMVLDRSHRSFLKGNPMVLLDGVPVFNIDKIMAFDPLKVKKLEVITSKFFNGPLAYDGLVSYKTYGGDLAGFELDPRALMQAYEGLQLQREFYAPKYETEELRNSRLADFRNLLHWQPTIKMQAGKEHRVEFYTSDQPGTYLVVVQGITPDGAAGSETYTFTVTQPAI